MLPCKRKPAAPLSHNAWSLPSADRPPAQPPRPPARQACESIPGKGIKQDQLVHAFSLHEEMKRAGLQPDAFTYATLFHLCAEARQASEGCGAAVCEPWVH